MEDKMTKARAALVLDHPFWGVLALRLRMRADPICKTLWTDGVELGYNPDYIKSLSIGVLKGSIGHEIMHVANQHNTRRGSRDPRKWNRACDYAINPLLLQAGLELPEGILLDDSFDGKAAEAIYSLLPSEGDDSPQETFDSGNSSATEGADSQGNQEVGNDPGGCGEIRDLPGEGGGAASEVEKTIHEQEWTAALTQAAQIAKRAGKLPAGMERFVKELVQPKIDWREVLRDFLEKSTRNDYSWLYPSRRYLTQGVYLPGLFSLGDLEKIVIAVDTSGSVSSDDLEQVASEIFSILDEFPETIIELIFCDYEFQGHQTITADDLPLQLEAKGGGGTSFIPPFEWLQKEGIEPVCLIYITDLACDQYPEQPGFPVLWIQTEENRYATSPPFGETILME